MSQYRDYNRDEIEAIQLEYGVKTVFSQNAKMKRSSQNGIHLYNWGIPAFKSKSGIATCPMASKCVSGCYAKMGAYVWDNVSQAYENRLNLSRAKGFEQVIVYHIDKLLKRHKTGLVMIRVHDSGDFYSKEYLEAWTKIANVYQTEKRVVFYAYTKMVQLVKDLGLDRDVNSNFKFIFSYGGLQDAMIDPEQDRHSRVFENETDLLKAGYDDASHDDTLAIASNHRIGLIYHGTKSFKNTTWNKVG